MKNKKVFLGVILFSLIQFTAYANSSWVWLTKTTPVNILPLAAVLTVAIESFIIIRYTHISKKLKAVLVVTAANILSFMIPFLIRYNELKIFYGDEPIFKLLETGPNYIVGFYYLLLTLIIEMPVVFFFLRNKDNMERLLKAILVSNILTTAMVFGMERLICRGAW